MHAEETARKLTQVAEEEDEDAKLRRFLSSIEEADCDAIPAARAGGAAPGDEEGRHGGVTAATTAMAAAAAATRTAEVAVTDEDELLERRPAFGC